MMGAQHKRPGAAAKMDRRRRAVAQANRELAQALTVYGEEEGFVRRKREALLRTEAKIAGVPFGVFAAAPDLHRAA